MSSHPVLTLVTSAALGFSTLHITGQTRKPAPDIAEIMTAKEFESAGLRKLTPSELDALNVWLAKYTNALTTSSARSAGASSTAAADVIESQIDDEFEGWDGDTIFKLRNGQIWQQTSYAYTYHYAYAPDVLIYKSGGVYKMKVEGVSGEISVRRIK